MRLHVAGGAGVRVVEPGAADAGALSKIVNVSVAGFEQLDAHADPAGPGTDDPDAHPGRLGGAS